MSRGCNGHILGRLNGWQSVPRQFLNSSSFDVLPVCVCVLRSFFQDMDASVSTKQRTIESIKYNGVHKA